MGMQYQYIQGEYKFWNNELCLPTKRRKADTGEVIYFHKKQGWDQVKGYWAYKNVGDCYELYRVYDNGNRRLVETNMHLTPDSVLYRICHKFYNVSDCDKTEERHGPVGPRREIATVYWGQMFDGKSIMALCAYRPKMSFKELMMVLENEGATVDAHGIIHRGR